MQFWTSRITLRKLAGSPLARWVYNVAAVCAVYTILYWLLDTDVPLPTMRCATRECRVHVRMLITVAIILVTILVATLLYCIWYLIRETYDELQQGVAFMNTVGGAAIITVLAFLGIGCGLFVPPYFMIKESSNISTNEQYSDGLIKTCVFWIGVVLTSAAIWFLVHTIRPAIRDTIDLLQDEVEMQQIKKG